MILNFFLLTFYLNGIFSSIQIYQVHASADSGIIGEFSAVGIWWTSRPGLAVNTSHHLTSTNQTSSGPWEF